MNIVEKAQMFAAGAHAGVGQKRKYTGEDYIHHPVAVAEIVRKHGGTDEMVAAAMLHDTIEDTQVTFDHIFSLFGDRVAEMVDALSNKAKKEDGNRETRFFINVKALRERLDMQSRVIKLADLIHNTQSITRYDQKFAAQYLAEKAFMLRALFTDAEIGVSGEEIESRTGDHPLLIEAEKMVATALSQLPDELFLKSDRINAGLMEKWKSMEA
ncbi:TPA: HD domain-containing protein [Klebsiella pneumoniae]|jgi:(p)ppGpp synthase/HD superfamily hydrolase|uniref:HD domain-containing protein n=1 Tax=Klebsiella pneumoniae complex TaxID=3390273 RepID=UPI0013728D16|nr:MULTISPECIES: HD domain-containing protein [Klebsiella]MBV0601400.1 HD domain-containing protein [Klebsiella pneumoniae]MBW5605502.1 HD domain-containing protein [Klebsiella pneumoniae]MCP3439425.1 HD domain-containing protein [Klebsiella variicola]MCP5574667.1 HD domain-containing protein [Klebsiella pneumoniae]MCP5938635.1 HD domain-containing protein [Klebsiella pneumoniae]